MNQAPFTIHTKYSPWIRFFMWVALSGIPLILVYVIWDERTLGIVGLILLIGAQIPGRLLSHAQVRYLNKELRKQAAQHPGADIRSFDLPPDVAIKEKNSN